jgi:hypothetical protein
MLELATRTLCAALVVALLAAAPAFADPGTTGGLPAIDAPSLSPQGGVREHGPAAPVPQAAQTGESPGEPPPDSTPTTPDSSPDEGDSTVEVPANQPASTQPSAGAAPSSSSGGGGGLPRTGFALAALIAVGTGFFLTGYALRYSRALDG